MKGLTETVGDLLKQLGESFGLAYYLPALVLVLIHSNLLLPFWAEHWLVSAPATSALPIQAEATPPSDPGVEGLATPAPPIPGTADSAFNVRQLFGANLDKIAGNTLGTLIVPLLIGIILVGLNGSLIRAFEGRPGWLKNGLLKPLVQRNRQESQKLYKDLLAAREAYDELKTRLAEASSIEEQQILGQTLASVEESIRQEHVKIETQCRTKTLPCDIERVKPTRFGNAYAVAEEYPLECYGADAVLFWPRLRVMMLQADPEHSRRITLQKNSLDMSVNFSIVFGLLSLEAGALLAVNFSPALLLLTLLGAILCVAFYYSSINAITLMGELIKASFDYHRGLILESFGLETPADLETERQVWNDLAAFLRRGEAFYFPAKFKTPPKAETSAEKPAQA